MNSALRVIILTPTALPCVTGNAITAERWRRSLSHKGIAVKVIETQQLDGRSLVYAMDRFRPHIIHAHHVSRAGSFLLDPHVSGRYDRVPLVVSPAGTDINHPTMGAAERNIVRNICRKACFLIIQNRETMGPLRDLLPDMEERITYVPKAFLWLGEESYDLRAAAGCTEKDILFFMPGGIRPVKGNLECLSAMAIARETSPHIRVVFAGADIETGYATMFQEQINRLHSFAKWILQIPPRAMHAAYEGADVVLNYSRSEGLSNALLEAMAAGKPVLASDIPGNRWLMNDEEGHGSCGVLFNPDDAADFVRKVLTLVNDGSFRESLAAKGRLRAARWPNPMEEAQALVKIYQAAITQKG